METYVDLGIAKLDLSRRQRTGAGEAIFCKSKTCEQLLRILQAFDERGCSVLGTKASPEQAAFVQAQGLPVRYDAISQILTLLHGPLPRLDAACGPLAVCCAGTSDLPIAEEAAQTAEFLGVAVERHYDVGVAGLHRLLSKLDEIRRAKVVIAVAGMEGALASVLSGLLSMPVIAVPTSVGYGASFQGLSSLLSMLNSCAEGLTVVNIDNGFGAATAAYRMLRLACPEESSSLP